MLFTTFEGHRPRPDATHCDLRVSGRRCGEGEHELTHELIHRMELNGTYAVLDVNSGAVHLVDRMTYDLLGVFDGTNDEAAVAALAGQYDMAELRELLGELHALMDEELLFSPDFDVPDTFAFAPVLKSLCLSIAHDCNLRCKYCFAGTGSFGGKRELMPREVARKAIDFAIAGSKKRHNLEIDLFGGEPLCNWPVVVDVIQYGARWRRRRASS